MDADRFVEDHVLGERSGRAAPTRIFRLCQHTGVKYIGIVLRLPVASRPKNGRHEAQKLAVSRHLGLDQRFDTVVAGDSASIVLRGRWIPPSAAPRVGRDNRGRNRTSMRQRRAGRSLTVHAGGCRAATLVSARQKIEMIADVGLRRLPKPIWSDPLQAIAMDGQRRMVWAQ